VSDSVNVEFKDCCPELHHIDLLPDGPIALCPNTCFTFTEVKLYDSDGTTVLETIALPNPRVVLTSNGDTNVDINDITGGVEVCLADGGTPDGCTITATYTDPCQVTYTDNECVDFSVCNLPIDGMLTIATCGADGDDYYFYTTFSDSGGDVVAGITYNTWCGNYYNIGSPSPGTNMYVYCTLGLGPETYWNKINWIINNRSGYSGTAVQNAIWYYTDGKSLSGHPFAKALVDAAEAYEQIYGLFCPECDDDVYAMLLTHNARCRQDIIIEVPRTCYCPSLQ
jgi:hypothetical protein